MGPWGVAALVALATCGTKAGRGYLKTALKTGIRAGYKAKDAANELVAKASEYKDELVAEIEAEREEKTGNGSGAPKKTKAAANHRNDEK